MRDLNEDSNLKYFFDFKLDWFEFSGEFDWHSSDTEEWFKINYDKFPKHLEFYKEHPITYHCNSDGFRSGEEYYEQKDREVDIVLGCSHTFGVGHHINNTWSHMLSQNTGREVINLGVPGHGPETSYIVLNKFIPFYKVRNVFHFQPIYPRYHVLQEYYDDNVKKYKHSTTNINSDHDYIMNFKYSDEYKSLMLDTQMIKYEHYKNVDAIRSTCQRFGAKYYGIYDNPYVGCVGVYPFKLNHFDNLEQGNIPARDMYHFPLFSQRQIANTFYKMYRGVYSNDFKREESYNEHSVKFKERDYDGKYQYGYNGEGPNDDDDVFESRSPAPTFPNEEQEPQLGNIFKRRI